MADLPKNIETLKEVKVDGEQFYKISNVDKMTPFFMSIVSSSNHWMFISSNGGLSAGRKDAESAIFPYYTDDKITESADTTGSKSIFQVIAKEGIRVWEPFSERQQGKYNCSQNLYKNLYGNKILFEETNHDFGLTFRYQWNSSDSFGFVKKSCLLNNSDDLISVKLLDGVQNLMPYGVSPELQGIRSNLVDAYKKCELEESVGLGIYALSAMIVDRAEPSEALKANVAWSIGLDNPIYLLSSDQLAPFRSGADIHQEVDIKARKGAYFVSKQIDLKPKSDRSWMIITEVNQTATTIAGLSKQIAQEGALQQLIEADIERGSQELIGLVAASDGFHHTADKKRDARHYSNTLFNIMRGGIFDDNYLIEKWDFEDYLKTANSALAESMAKHIASLPDQFSLQELRALIDQQDDADFKRLALEYMPLKFSRRHGDPSRPWNKFTINTKNDDGSKILDYEGNWRDIFQNWEALAKSYPVFLDSMILKFLNASTFDGYNPYRVTKDGFDWEAIEENDPWSYIGYWGDHQIIYLLKLLEAIKDHYPARLSDYFTQNLFVYANVPYKIKPYDDLLKNPKDTILFDHELDAHIQNKRIEVGSDGALLADRSGEVYRVNFIEKILATTLAKMSNFTPEGGIWLNTQRPEWNDANNALVGNGVSMVTLGYLRRFLSFFKDLLEDSAEANEFSVSIEIGEFFDGVKATLDTNLGLLDGHFNDKQRKVVLDGLGQAGSKYREKIYANSFSGERQLKSQDDLLAFIEVSLSYLEHSIRANKRQDNMYHAYNLMTVENSEEVSIGYLDEMLEGQVAALSSGYLSSDESLQLLNGLKSSALFREDQYSYILYPNKELKRFTDKNLVSKSDVESSSLLSHLVMSGDTQIIEKDISGDYHFNGNFNNADSLRKVLDELAASGFEEKVKEERKHILDIFEKVFNHKAFTGRSGTFFGYEGLGSIYWHMVSKLLLAVEETCLRAVKSGESKEVIGQLMEHFYEINEGIGVHKSPDLYGAFSIDPYSHTPSSKGVQQPGMTGQVKEDILSRIGELGAFVEAGKLSFRPTLLRAEELIKNPDEFHYVDVNQNRKEIQLTIDSLAFTYCQVPIIYTIGKEEAIEVTEANGNTETVMSHLLPYELSQRIFDRSGHIESIKVMVLKESLK